MDFAQRLTRVCGSDKSYFATRGFKDDRLDEVLDKDAEELDHEKRCTMIDAQKIIMENALMPVTVGQGQFWGLNRSMKGFELTTIAWAYCP